MILNINVMRNVFVVVRKKFKCIYVQLKCNTNNDNGKTSVCVVTLKFKGAVCSSI